MFDIDEVDIESGDYILHADRPKSTLQRLKHKIWFSK